MHGVNFSKVCGLAIWLAIIPTAVRAQSATGSFDEVARVLAPGERVVVTDTQGQRLKGRVAEVSPASITLLTSDNWGVGARRRIERSAVTAIRRTDSLWNGVLIGLGAGVAATEIWARQQCGSHDAECTAIVRAIGWVAFVPGGAVTGALVDKALGNRLVYRAGGGATLRVRPQLDPSQARVSVTLTF